jgi:hypothetical protein
MQIAPVDIKIRKNNALSIFALVIDHLLTVDVNLKSAIDGTLMIFSP